MIRPTTSKPKIAPSILAADFLSLGEQIQAAELGGADRIHLDVMDGRFVPNISFGVPVVKAARRATTLPLETHLMIVEPERYISAFAEAGSDLILVHVEAAFHLDRLIQQIKDHGKKAGIVLNPATPVAAMELVVEQIDLVLLMTVNPGFGGQRFIPYSLDKIRRVRQLLDDRNPGCDLEVDGGIEPETIRAVWDAGARVFVAGTAVFGHAQGPAQGIKSLLAQLPTYA